MVKDTDSELQAPSVMRTVRRRSGLTLLLPAVVACALTLALRNAQSSTAGREIRVVVFVGGHGERKPNVPVACGSFRAQEQLKFTVRSGLSSAAAFVWLVERTHVTYSTQHT